MLLGDNADLDAVLGELADAGVGVGVVAPAGGGGPQTIGALHAGNLARRAALESAIHRIHDGTHPQQVDLVRSYLVRAAGRDQLIFGPFAGRTSVLTPAPVEHTRSMRLPFVQVDVFSPVPYCGNPVAVVLDADGLDDETMQRIARWTNLSETTFVTTPTGTDADYGVRIFTPVSELPFAGHPTLGTCHAWLAHTGRALDAVTQQCPAGPVAIRRIDGRLAFAGPPLLRSGPVDDACVPTSSPPSAWTPPTSWPWSGPTTGRAGSPSSCAPPMRSSPSARSTRNASSGSPDRTRRAPRPPSRCAPSSPWTAPSSRIP